MNSQALISAIKHVMREDGMTQDYENRLVELIQNAMRANLDESDIEELLAIIEIEGHADEG